ncbi:MAG: VOC family protein [Calditrichaeota bacterium]|nr:MAG: VOC family protein [Calditrichota bacterium]
MTQKEQDRRIDYIEFPVLDINAAKNFYSKVFGWVFQDWGQEYTSFTDGRLNGGFAKAGTVKTGGPLVVLYALDLAGIEEAITANGGKVIKETYDFPGGRRFHFRDPSGHELAVWSDK